jgi:hypothetical protein
MYYQSIFCGRAGGGWTTSPAAPRHLLDVLHRFIIAIATLHRHGCCPSCRGALKNPKEALMRIPALAMLTIAAALTATPAPAQTYDPRYPVCLQVYQGFTDYYFECGYTSIAQCQMSASGRAAQCIVNPYYAGRKAPARRKQRRAY